MRCSRRARIRIALTWCPALVASMALTGCASDAASSLPGPDGIRITTPAGGGCPPTISGVRDVVAAGSGTSELLPRTFTETGATVCTYSSTLRHGAARGRLQQTTTLAQQRARLLAAAVRAVEVVDATGGVSCPADYGTVTIIEFHSASRSRDIDLWWRTSGCQTLDDGVVRTTQAGNPSFGRFQSAFEQVTSAG